MRGTGYARGRALSVARARAIRRRGSFVGGAAPCVKGTVPAIVSAKSIACQARTTKPGPLERS